MADADVKTFIATFTADPLLSRMPLPATIRHALNLPEDPEPTILTTKESVSKALFANDADTFEERPYPKDIPIPDFEAMAKALREKYDLVSAELPKVEVLPEEKSAQDMRHDN